MAKTPYSPADEIAKYNKIFKDQGYDFFSPKGLDAHKKKYGDKATGDIVSEAKEKYAAFMKACNDINHPDHTEAHNTLMTKYVGDPKVALASFKRTELKQNGRLDEQYPIKKPSYEKETLENQKPEKSANKEELRQWGVLRSLLQAKWKAVGYEGDEQAILQFNMDYAHTAV